MVPDLFFAICGAVCGTNLNKNPHRYARVGDINHDSPLERSNPTYCGHRRQVANGGRAATQLQIAMHRSGTLHRMLNLPDITGTVQHHHDLDNALHIGAAHPHLHKLAAKTVSQPWLMLSSRRLTIL